MREMLPSYEGKKLLYEGFDQMSPEDKSKELWETFAAQPKIMHQIEVDYAPWNWNLEDDYHPN